MFAALNVGTGQVQAQHTRRRRRVEFLAFMNQIIARHGDREIHVVLDNLKIHRSKHERWLQRHKNVRFHYTPTHVSWLNQIEIWFSKLSRDALKGASFTSPAQLRRAIDKYIQVHNTTDQGQPFDISIPLGATKQILAEVMVKIVRSEHMTREGVVRLRIEVPRSIQIDRMKTD